MKASELLELVNDDVVIAIMEENGSAVLGKGETSEGKPYLIFRTICHGGDSPKLYYYSESKTFHCWTNCGTMSFYTCIMKIRGLTEKQFYQCLSYVADKVGVQLRKSPYGFGQVEEEKPPESIFEYNKLNQIREGEEEEEEIAGIQKFYKEDLLKFFDRNIYYQGWIDEGISIETMKRFKIGYYPWEGWVTIPCFDIDNNLIGIRRRALDHYYDGQIYPPKDKYKPLEWEGQFYTFPTSKALYGIDVNKEVISRRKTCVLFEGEKSVMKTDSYFGEFPALAVYGSSISEWQMRELEKLGVINVYLAFDKDYNYANESKYKDTDERAGYLFSKSKRNNTIKKLSERFETRVIGDVRDRLDTKDSPVDKGKDVFEFLYSKAVPASVFLKG